MAPSLPAPAPPEWRAALRRGSYLAAALAVIAAGALIVFGGGVAEVGHALGRVPPAFLVLAAAGVALEWLADAARFVAAGRALDVSRSFGFWLEVALVNLFAAYVANIGPPVAAYVMAKRGVPPGQALAVTVGKHLLFFPSALGPGWLFLLLSSDRPGGEALFGTLTAMVALSVAMLAAMAAVAFRPAAAERLLGRLPFARTASVAGFVAGMSRFFRGRPRLLLGSFVLALANQAAIVLTVCAVLQGLGGHALATGALGRCFLFSTLSQIAPTPGGAGLSEAGGVLLFRPLLDDAALAAHVVLCRLFCAGLPILAGGLLLARELRAVSLPPLPQGDPS
jgi:uncharacterized protein (TIRG00374 family)